MIYSPTPDRRLIRLHLEVLFRELLPGGSYDEGLFELRFIEPNDRRIKCRLFRGEEIEKAIDLAIQLNKCGWNAYVGINPRTPHTEKSGKASDIDRAFFQFVDCDDAKSSALLTELPFPPNFIVTTGTTPTLRLHGYFMLEVPETNLSAYSCRQEALALSVNGDNIKDLPRIMRLAGTVSYPTLDKAGRGYIPELVTISDVDPHAWAAEDLDALLSRLKAPTSVHLKNSPFSTGRETLRNVPIPEKVKTLLTQSKVEHHWHNSMLRATAQLLIRGFSEEQVVEICGPFCHEGTSDQDLRALIKSAIKKGITSHPAELPLNIVSGSPRHEGNLLNRSNIIKAGEANYVTSQSYLIKNWLPFEGTGVLFGPSNTGKTFVALNMAACIAGGIPWHGHKVQKGAALYLATEGSFSFHNRMAAVRQDLNLNSDAPLIARADMVNLLDPTGDLLEIQALADEISTEYGPIRFLVIDTLARAMAGGNENAPDDMTKLIGNVDALRQRTGAFVLLIHHTGKDETRGARGHSSLLGAVDAMLMLKSSEEVIRLVSEKQRDMPEPQPKAFRLHTVECGQDLDGDLVTTCVVRQTGHEHFKEVKRPKGPNQTLLMECFHQLALENVGRPNPAGVGFPEQGQYRCIPASEVRSHFAGKYSGPNPSSAFKSALDGLRAKGLMEMTSDLMWLPTHEGKY